MFPSLPGAMGECDPSPPNFLVSSSAAAAGALSSLPCAAHVQLPGRSSAYVSETGSCPCSTPSRSTIPGPEAGHSRDSDDEFEVTILPSRKW